MSTVTAANLYSEVNKVMELHSSRRHDEAKVLADGIFEFFESNKAEHLKGLYFFILGMRFHVRSEFNEAIANFEKGFRHANDEGNQAAINHMATGFSNKSMGNLDEAVSHFFLAIEKLDPKGPVKGFLFYCYLQLGEIHVSIDEHEVALDFFNKALETSDGNLKHRPLLFNVVGVCYHSMRQFKQSKEYQLKALHEEDISPVLLSKVQNDLGVLYLDINEFEQAETLLKKSILFRKESNMEDATGTGMCFLAETYLKQHKTSEAIEMLEQCRVIAERYQTKWKEVKILRLLATAYSLNGDYKTANWYFEKYGDLQNEIKSGQEKKILKLKNEQIERQKKVIQDKHQQLSVTFEEIKQLKINRKAVFFSWVTVIVLVLISEMFLDPFIENYSYNKIISLVVKIGIALLFKPLDGLYEKILWDRTIRKAG